MLMTAKEMNKRLDAGEDPLDLVEEKWKRLKTYVEEKGLEGVVSENFHADTCAFCSVFMNKSEKWYKKCWECPYMIVRGISCDEALPCLSCYAPYAPFDVDMDTSEPWCEMARVFGSWLYAFLEETRRYDFIQACDKMLAVIDEIQNGTKKE